jgi:hypothetical protein
MRISFLAVAVLATAGGLFYFGTPVHAAKGSEALSASHVSANHVSASQPLPLKSLALPLVFEPNQGQTAPQVKYRRRNGA